MSLDGNQRRLHGSRRGEEPPVRPRSAIDGEEMLVKLKEHEMEVEMEVDAGVPRANNAEIKEARKGR